MKCTVSVVMYLMHFMTSSDVSLPWIHLVLVCQLCISERHKKLKTWHVRHVRTSQSDKNMYASVVM